jgi:MFS transporter
MQQILTRREIGIMSEPNYKSTLRACCLGYVTQAAVVNLAPLLFVIFQENFGLSFTMIGSLVLFNFVVQLLIDAVAIRFVDRIGYRASVMIAHGFSAAGLLLLGILPHVMPAYAGLLIAVFLYAIGGGLIEVLISPIVDSLPGDAKASTMSLLHSFYSWGQVAVVALSTLLLQVLGHSLWFLLPALWAILPVANLFYFLRVPLIPPVEETHRLPLKKLLTSRVFVAAMLLMVCSGAAEQAMSQWASLFAEKALGISKVIGDLLGPCIFAVMMGIGRTLYGTRGQRLNLQKALFACAALCIASYLLTALVPVPAVALIGCALCGLSVSLMWPGMLSLSSAGYPTGGTAMFALLALCGDLGCSAGPWLTGLVSDAAQNSAAIVNWGAAMGSDPTQTGLKIGLLAAVLFPLIMLFGILYMRRQMKKS